nr:DUF2878 domain-containing protein [Gilvimarinus xylanilyticus]
MANAAMFQIGWLLCLMAPLAVALVYTLAAIAVHFLYWGGHRQDVIAVILAIAMGFIHDTALLVGGVLQYSLVIQPLWLMCLWALLGLTLNHSLHAIYGRPWLAAILGAVSAPLSYIAGVAISGVSWGVPKEMGASIIALVWLGVLPLHLALSRILTRLVFPRTDNSPETQ